MVPIYCVVQKVCKVCNKIPFEKMFKYFLPHNDDFTCNISIEPVDYCGYRQYVFENNNDTVVHLLIDLMMQQQKCVWIAHNGGRFDSLFLLRHQLVEKKIIPESVMNRNQAQNNPSKSFCHDNISKNIRMIAFIS